MLIGMKLRKGKYELSQGSKKQSCRKALGHTLNADRDQVFLHNCHPQEPSWWVPTHFSSTFCKPTELSTQGKVPRDSVSFCPNQTLKSTDNSSALIKDAPLVTWRSCSVLTGDFENGLCKHVLGCLHGDKTT